MGMICFETKEKLSERYANWTLHVCLSKSSSEMKETKVWKPGKVNEFNESKDEYLDEKEMFMLLFSLIFNRFLLRINLCTADWLQIEI
jgi:hypothetical protein